MNFNIIGAGRLGKTLALALTRLGNAELKAICNKDYSSAKRAAEHVGAGRPAATLDNLPAVDLTFITTTDEAIAGIAQKLVAQKITVGSIVVHCSGVLNSAVLEPLRELGCHIASLHPLKAFRADDLDQNAFQDCFCTIEGDAYALQVLTPLFSSLGAQVVVIRAGDKIVYHAAAVIASNYLVTLAATATHLLTETAIPAAIARQMVTSLLQSSLSNVQQSVTIESALTGPLLRGDLATVDAHLQALQGPAVNNLYRAAALATLPFTPLSSELKAAAEALLTHHNE